MKTLLDQARWEQRSYWRNPAAAAFTFAFPLLFLVIFTAINGNSEVQLHGGVVKFAQFYVPAILAFGLISATYTNLAFTVTRRRDTGILKRVRGTPLRPVTYLGGMAINAVIVALILSVLVLLLGLLAYGITFPGRYFGLVVTAALGAFCFGSLGFAVSTFVPNQDAAPAIVNFVLLPLLFISGTFGKINDDSTLAKIANIFPIRHLNQQMLAVFNPFASGTGIVASHSAMLLAWGAAGLAVSLRRFRWEP